MDNKSLTMPGTWHPVHENHAIDVMAVMITFADPLPDLLFKRVLKAAEDEAFEAGLRSRHSINPIVLGAGNANVEIAGFGGRLFNSLDEMSASGPVPARLKEQLQVTPNQIIYRNWQYISWQWQLKRLSELLGSTFALTAGNVFVMSSRLEYLDRFRFDGEKADAHPDGVLVEGSGWLAPHIFGRRDLWHSHSGAYMSDEGSTKRLEQIHVDAVDGPAPDDTQARWLNVMTARENRYQDPEIDQSTEGLFADWNVMHDDLISLAGKILTADMAKRIFLNAKNAS